MNTNNTEIQQFCPCLNFKKIKITRISVSTNTTSLKWLTVAMPLLETSERLERETRERDKRETT